MAQEVINIGAAPNDGQGDPIRTSFFKCNNNFTELYDRVQTSPPGNLQGSLGDVAGMYAYDSNYFYYCFANYDGSSTIWGQLGGSTPVALQNGTSNVAVAASGPVTVAVGGVGNALVVTAANVTALGNVIAANSLLSNGLAVSGPATVSGSITTGNLLPAANVTYDLGSATSAWRDLYLSGSTIYLDGATITANATAMTLTTETGAAFVVGGTGGNSTASFGTLDVTGNVTAADITASGNVDADRVNANYFIGDGSLLTNVTATANVAVTQIANGTTIMSIPVANDPVRVQVSGVSNVAVFTAAGSYFAGIVQATGNITGGNLNTAGNVNAANLNVSGGIYGVLNTSGAVAIANTASATSTTTGALTVAGGAGVAGNVYVGGLMSVTGNITSAAGITGATVSAATAELATATVSTLANVTATTAATSSSSGALRVAGGAGVEGNLFVGGIFNAAGNATVANVLVSETANVAFLDVISQINVKASAQSTSTITGAIVVAGGAGLGGNLTAGENVTATGNVVGGNIVTLGQVTATGNVTGGNIIATDSVLGNGRSLTSLSASNLDSGTVPSGRLTGSYSISVTGSAATVTTAAQPNITSVGTLTSLTVTGNVTGGNIITAGAVSTAEIIKTGSNGVGNIGSSSNYFNTVFAQATSAQYADLAEYYVSDQAYAPGTVMKFGGDREVTAALHDHDAAVIGVVTTNPAHVMNAGLESLHRVAIALAGRVPCRVTGKIRRGDMLVTAGRGEARSEPNPKMGTVIGKALEDFDGVAGMIEIVVGRI